MPQRPDFLGVGAQKCASTWIHRILESHPAVAVSTPKELDFFSYAYDRGFSWYEKHFPETEKPGFNKPGLNKIECAGEISPSYFYNGAAVARAQHYNPAFKIIVALRDPIERMYSHHLHECRKGHIQGDETVFEKAMTRNPMYLHQSLYAKHLKMWIEAFGRENIFVTLQENIAADPRAEAKLLCDFLSIDGAFDSTFFHRRANENVVYKNAAVGAVYSAAGGAARAAGLGGAVHWAKRMQGISHLWSSAKKNVRDDIAPMEHQTIEELRSVLGPEMRALAKMLNIDAMPWANWSSYTSQAA